MSESTLLIVFVSFSLFLIIGVIVLRKISVWDIFDDVNPPSLVTEKSSFSESRKQSATFGANQENEEGDIKRKNINNIAKTLGVVGAIMLFAPLPSFWNNIGIGLAFLGYLVAKASAEPKKKKQE